LSNFKIGGPKLQNDEIGRPKLQLNLKYFPFPSLPSVEPNRPLVTL